MTLSPTPSRSSLVSVVHLRAAGVASVWIRTAGVGVLAIVGGVLAGALVVAPVVERASHATVAWPESQTGDGALASVMTVARKSLKQALIARSALIASLPAPVSRYGAPTLALISIVGALTAALISRKGASDGPTRKRNAASAPDRIFSRPTPRNGGGAVGKHSRTPREVAALAAHGASASDIARRTKLPLDAVQLLLAISTGPRQLHPPTA